MICAISAWSPLHIEHSAVVMPWSPDRPTISVLCCQRFWKRPQLHGIHLSSYEQRSNTPFGTFWYIWVSNNTWFKHVQTAWKSWISSSSVVVNPDYPWGEINSTNESSPKQCCWRLWQITNRHQSTLVCTVSSEKLRLFPIGAGDSDTQTEP